MFTQSVHVWAIRTIYINSYLLTFYPEKKYVIEPDKLEQILKRIAKYVRSSKPVLSILIFLTMLRNKFICMMYTFSWLG